MEFYYVYLTQGKKSIKIYDNCFREEELKEAKAYGRKCLKESKEEGQTWIAGNWTGFKLVKEMDEEVWE